MDLWRNWTFWSFCLWGLKRSLPLLWLDQWCGWDCWSGPARFGINGLHLVPRCAVLGIQIFLRAVLQCPWIPQCHIATASTWTLQFLDRTILFKFRTLVVRLTRPGLGNFPVWKESMPTKRTGVHLEVWQVHNTRTLTIFQTSKVLDKWPHQIAKRCKTARKHQVFWDFCGTSWSIGGIHIKDMEAGDEQ